jgi:glycine cleavage system H protein
MSNIPTELQFSKTHEWVRQEDDQTVVVGITDHAQHLLGDIVFVELPEVGDQVHATDELAVIESVKAAADVYSPVSGEVIAVNDALTEAPGNINQNPYEDGWLCKIKMTDESELKDLASAEDYQQLVAEEEEA